MMAEMLPIFNMVWLPRILQNRVGRVWGGVSSKFTAYYRDEGNEIGIVAVFEFILLCVACFWLCVLKMANRCSVAMCVCI